MRKAIARSTIRVVLDIEHARQGDAVAAPTPSALKEVIGLGSAGGRIRSGEVVSAADESGVCGTDIVAVKRWVFVICPLGGLFMHRLSLEYRIYKTTAKQAYLDDHKAGSISVRLLKIDIGLVVGNIETLDGCVCDAAKSSDTDNNNVRKLHDEINVQG